MKPAETPWTTWMLSKLYERVGDEENRLKYLVLSAMADVRASNKEIASLEEYLGHSSQAR